MKNTIKKGGIMKFEYQFVNDGKGGRVRFVALNESLNFFKVKIKMVNGTLVKSYEAMTIKDCTKIDGCIYFAAGRVSDSEMIRMIELFQKALKEKGWKPNITADIYDKDKSDKQKS